MEAVAVRAGYKVLMEVNDNILLIVGNPQGILEDQLRSHPILLILIILINYIKLNISKLFLKMKTIPSKCEKGLYYIWNETLCKKCKQLLECQNFLLFRDTRDIFHELFMRVTYNHGPQKQYNY